MMVFVLSGVQHFDSRLENVDGFYKLTVLSQNLKMIEIKTFFATQKTEQ